MRDIAAAAGVPTSFDLNNLWDPDLRCWLVKTTEHHHVVVKPMMYNDRTLLLRRHGDVIAPFNYDEIGAWRYQKGGRAIIFALAFDPEVDKAPEGWFKDVVTDYVDFEQPGAPEKAHIPARRRGTA